MASNEVVSDVQMKTDTTRNAHITAILDFQFMDQRLVDVLKLASGREKYPIVIAFRAPHSLPPNMAPCSVTRDRTITQPAPSSAINVSHLLVLQLEDVVLMVSGAEKNLFANGIFY